MISKPVQSLCVFLLLTGLAADALRSRRPRCGTPLRHCAVPAGAAESQFCGLAGRSGLGDRCAGQTGAASGIVLRRLTMPISGRRS